jgi:pilus assembly protein Flp/PilA
VSAIRTIFRTLRRDQSGATAIEYGLIIALISIAALGAMHGLGGNNGGAWDNMSDKVVNALNG